MHTSHVLYIEEFSCIFKASFTLNSIPFAFGSSLPIRCIAVFPHPMAEFTPPAHCSGSAFSEIVGGCIQSQPSTRPSFDIFINHCGQDTKKNVASTLHYLLAKSMTLQAFLDEPILHPGDLFPAEIEHAINSAVVHLAVISDHYPKRRWCLFELCLMLETRAPIFPLFCDVQISDLQWTEMNGWTKVDGVCAEAFKEHEEKKRFDPQTLRKWKQALNAVSYLPGPVFSLQKDDLTSVLKEVVKSVVKEVKRRRPLHVGAYVVGLDEAAEDIRNQILRFGHRIVGIAGMQGAGKTTLAKHLYNLVRCDYEEDCFLEDIARNTKEKPVKALEFLQGQLIKKLSHIDDKGFSSMNQRQAYLAELMAKVQALVILDDINHKSHLGALLMKMDGCGSGSLIVVTSRDKRVLQGAGIPFIYELQDLDAKHAQELFCWYAFGGPRPTNGFEGKVADVLTRCGGLPLSLEIYGKSFHRSKDKHNWKVSEMVCDQRSISDMLKNSYDALSEEEQRIFLHCGCHLVDKDKSAAIAMLDKLRLSGSEGLEALEQKFLIAYDNKNCLKMHNHLQDLAQDIVRENSFKDSHRSRCSRHPEDANGFGRRRSENMVVAGLSLTHSHPSSQTASDSKPRKCWRSCFTT